jgi:hypothetical protein
MTPEQQAEFLETIPTAALYEEFKRRFDHCVAAGLMKRPTADDSDHFVMSYTYKGTALLCQGLAIQTIVKCQKDIDALTNEMPLEDL